MVYPGYPDTFWSFKHALKFVSKKAVNPPLSLITISSMLPGNWQKKLIDLNIEQLRDRAMNVQSDSVEAIIQRCHLSWLTWKKEFRPGTTP